MQPSQADSVLTIIPRPSRNHMRRFFAKVTVAQTGCWEWHGARVGHGGYGRFTLQHVQVLTHRAAYRWFVGPFDTSLAIDHLCANTKCVNPAHLEPVTTAENARRKAATKTHCHLGHAYSPDNVLVMKSSRTCRICREASVRRWNELFRPAWEQRHSEMLRARRAANRRAV